MRRSSAARRSTQRCPGPVDDGHRVHDQLTVAGRRAGAAGVSCTGFTPPWVDLVRIEAEQVRDLLDHHIVD